LLDLKHLLQVFNVQFAYLQRFQSHLSIDPNDFDVLAHPIQRQVDPAAVSARFDFLFDYLYPEYPELGLWGLAWIFRLAADLFQAGFSFQGNHILLQLAESVDFLSARIHRFSRLAPAEFPMTGGWLCKVTEFIYDFTDDPLRPGGRGGAFPAIN
jgi:hypothetical protein